MTVQRPDNVIFQNKRYRLIDIEKGKSIISEIDLVLPEGYEPELISSCWRRYTATYDVVNNTLYGRKRVKAYKKLIDDEWDIITVFSDRVRLHYTGSCIVAYDKRRDVFSDGLLDFLDFNDDVLELHFTDGVLDEARSLNNVVKEYQFAISVGMIRIDDDIEDDIVGSYERFKAIDSFVRSHLKYQYDKSTYKWTKR